jgi:hypothetical protein
MTPQMLDIAAALCAAVLGIQLTAIVVVWVMECFDRIAVRDKHGRANEN